MPVADDSDDLTLATKVPKSLRHVCLSRLVAELRGPRGLEGVHDGTRPVDLPPLVGGLRLGVVIRSAVVRHAVPDGR